jgi:hypothetical protein
VQSLQYHGGAGQREGVLAAGRRDAVVQDLCLREAPDDIGEQDGVMGCSWSATSKQPSWRSKRSTALSR